MSWLLVVGCIFIAGIVIYCLNKANRLRRPSHPSSIRWRDISTLPSNRPTPTPDQSSIVWRDLPPELSNFNPQEFTLPEFELVELWESEDVIANPSNGNSTFLDPGYNPTIQELLKSVIGSRDILTQAEFRPRQQVYFCSNCTLAHHQDSWRESGNRCNQCGSSEHTRLYTLPDND
jgi:hypothetical protein